MATVQEVRDKLAECKKAGKCPTDLEHAVVDACDQVEQHQKSAKATAGFNWAIVLQALFAALQAILVGTGASPAPAPTP